MASLKRSRYIYIWDNTDFGKFISPLLASCYAWAWRHNREPSLNDRFQKEKDRYRFLGLSKGLDFTNFPTDSRERLILPISAGSSLSETDTLLTNTYSFYLQIVPLFQFFVLRIYIFSLFLPVLQLNLNIFSHPFLFLDKLGPAPCIFNPRVNVSTTMALLRIDNFLKEDERLKDSSIIERTSRNSINQFKHPLSIANIKNRSKFAWKSGRGDDTNRLNTPGLPGRSRRKWASKGGRFRDRLWPLPGIKRLVNTRRRPGDR